MATPSLFAALCSSRMAELISRATDRVVYAAPGIQDKPAAALRELALRPEPPALTVSVDFDERTIRMGYGSLQAIELLREAGVELVHFPGFRSGILLVDKRGWIFTPVAHYLEDEPQSDETPNAIELSATQVEAYAVRFCPAAREEAIAAASTPEVAQALFDLPEDLGVTPIVQDHFVEVKKAITAAPPVKFDVVRQVRVFEPYLQYVEMSLTGAAIQKRRITVPASIQSLGSSKNLEGRLRTTFDLLEKSSALSSKELEEEIHEIRKNLTRSLGKNHGRVVLKAAKPTLEVRIKALRRKLEKHQERVREKLQAALDKSRKEVVKYYLPLAKKKTPDAVVGESLAAKPDDNLICRWLDRELAKVFPLAEDLVGEMVLEVRFKDVTFETLNAPNFLESVKAAFPENDWDKAYNEFRAAGERKRPAAGGAKDSVEA